MSFGTAYAEAWEMAEQGLFRYLCRALGHRPGVEAYRLEDLPRGMPTLGAAGVVWVFLISGGPIGVHRQSRTEIPRGLWEMNAEFTGRCWRAAAARRLGCQVLEALPAGPKDVRGVIQLYATGHPSVERKLAPATSAERAGEEAIVFEVQVPLKAVFTT